MHMFMFTAHALVGGPQIDEVSCPLGEETLCVRVNRMIEHSNNESGTTVIRRTWAPVRLHPDTLFDVMLELDEAMALQGCALAGEVGGTYFHEWSGLATVDGNPSVLTGASIQPIDPRARTFPGNIDGFNVVGLPFLGQFSHFKNDGTFIASVNDGLLGAADFWAGKWVRTNGRRGVFIGARVTCSAGDDPAVVARDWYGPQLDAFAR